MNRIKALEGLIDTSPHYRKLFKGIKAPNRMELMSFIKRNDHLDKGDFAKAVHMAYLSGAFGPDSSLATKMEEIAQVINQAV